MRILLVLFSVLLLSVTSANSQAWKTCIRVSIGPGGCESIGPGGGLSIGPGGGMSIGPGGGKSVISPTGLNPNTMKPFGYP